MNLTQFERVKSELKQIFYGQNKLSGSLVIIQKRIFISNCVFYVFRGAKRIFAKALQDCGQNLEKGQGLFNKSYTEPLSSYLVRSCSIGRPAALLGGHGGASCRGEAQARRRHG